MKIYPRTYEQVEAALVDCRSLRELTANLGYAVSGGNCRTVKKVLEAYGFPMPTGARRGLSQPLSVILVVNSTYTDSKTLKKRLLKEGVLVEECALCFTGPSWLGLPLTLQLDHINGDHQDNRLENLRILCPNCHSQTHTWGGRNVRSRRELNPL